MRSACQFFNFAIIKRTWNILQAVLLVYWFPFIGAAPLAVGWVTWVSVYTSVNARKFLNGCKNVSVLICWCLFYRHSCLKEETKEVADLERNATAIGDRRTYALTEASSQDIGISGRDSRLPGRDLWYLSLAASLYVLATTMQTKTWFQISTLNTRKWWIAVLFYAHPSDWFCEFVCVVPTQNNSKLDWSFETPLHMDALQDCFKASE